MNLILAKTKVGDKVTLLGKTDARGLWMSMLVLMLAGIAWSLNYMMVTVLLVSILPGIGLYIIIGKIQEEAGRNSPDG